MSSVVAHKNFREKKKQPSMSADPDKSVLEGARARASHLLLSVLPYAWSLENASVREAFQIRPVPPVGAPETRPE